MSLLTSQLYNASASKEFLLPYNVPFARAADAWLLALFGPHAKADLSLECAPKRTSADHSEFMGSGPN